MEMADSGNGRAIRIPVRKVARQLPLTEDKPPPLLTAPQDCREKEAETRTQYEEELASLRERASLWRAEASGIRKRSERRAETQIRQERQRLLHRLLTVTDNLERALAHSNRNDPLRAGVQLILDDLLAQLAQEGVVPILALGRRFDPTLHEAIATDGSSGDSVVEVVRTGYTLDGETLRAATVIVGHPGTHHRADQDRRSR